MNKTPAANGWPWWRWTLVGLNVLAIILSAILSWHYLKGGGLAGCTGTSACEQVLSSSWSTIGGRIPVSGLAMGVYLTLFVGGFYTTPDTESSLRRLAWGISAVLSGSVFAMAIWFIILQKWVIGEFCPYCMATHLTGILIAIVVCWRAAIDFRNPADGQRPGLIWRLMIGGIVLSGPVMLSQVMFRPTEIASGGELSSVDRPVSYDNAPMIGTPTATYVVSVLFDYQCPHCQQLHGMLDEAVQRYRGKLAFVLCPTPLSMLCNPYIPEEVDAFKNSCELARTGMAVWFARREAFREFDHWMFSAPDNQKWQPRSLSDAREKAIGLVGKAEFDKNWSSPKTDQYLQASIGRYGQTAQSGSGGVPKLIFGSHWVIPRVGNTTELLDVLHTSLGIPDLGK